MSTIFDIQQSIAAANGNTSLAKELFTMLLKDLEKRFQQIETSFKQNNMEMLSEHIHKLYGATAYCIVPQLRKNTEILEGVLRNKDYSQLNELVNNVQEEIQQLINTGSSYLEKNWEDYQ